MSILTGDTLDTYGGAKNDYSPVIDATTDLAAAEGNAAMAATAAMSRMRFACWARFTTAGTATPTLTAHEELWGAVGLAPPVIVRTGAGTYHITYPTNVQDEIGRSSPGYSGPTPLNLRAGIGQAGSTLAVYTVQVIVLSSNVLAVGVSTAGSLGDTTGVVVDVWGF